LLLDAEDPKRVEKAPNGPVINAVPRVAPLPFGATMKIMTPQTSPFGDYEFELYLFVTLQD
jgi:hypothetical protein